MHGQLIPFRLTIAGATVAVASCVGVGSTGGSASTVEGAGSVTTAGTGVFGGKSRFNNDEVAKDVTSMVMVAERKVPF